MKPPSLSCLVAAAIALTLLVGRGARADDYAAIDATDKGALERALFLCLWRTSHPVPDHAPTPAVCTSSAVSIDEALLQTKQWWMYWARFDNPGVGKANTQFGQDFLAFQSRRRQHPEIAAELLPPGVKLANDDWRVLLVQELKSRPTASP